MPRQDPRLPIRWFPRSATVFSLCPRCRDGVERASHSRFPDTSAAPAAVLSNRLVPDIFSNARSDEMASSLECYAFMDQTSLPSRTSAVACARADRKWRCGKPCGLCAIISAAQVRFPGARSGSAQDQPICAKCSSIPRRDRPVFWAGRRSGPHRPHAAGTIDAPAALSLLNLVLFCHAYRIET